MYNATVGGPSSDEHYTRVLWTTLGTRAAQIGASIALLAPRGTLYNATVGGPLSDEHYTRVPWTTLGTLAVPPCLMSPIQFF